MQSDAKKMQSDAKKMQSDAKKMQSFAKGIDICSKLCYNSKCQETESRWW